MDMFFVVVGGQKSLFIVLQYIIYIICSNTGMGQNWVTQTLGWLYNIYIYIHIILTHSYMFEYLRDISGSSLTYMYDGM